MRNPPPCNQAFVLNKCDCTHKTGHTSASYHYIDENTNFTCKQWVRSVGEQLVQDNTGLAATSGSAPTHRGSKNMLTVYVS